MDKQTKKGKGIKKMGNSLQESTKAILDKVYINIGKELMVKLQEGERESIGSLKEYYEGKRDKVTGKAKKASEHYIKASLKAIEVELEYAGYATIGSDGELLDVNGRYTDIEYAELKLDPYVKSSKESVEMLLLNIEGESKVSVGLKDYVLKVSVGKLANYLEDMGYEKDYIGWYLNKENNYAVFNMLMYDIGYQIIGKYVVEEVEGC